MNANDEEIVFEEPPPKKQTRRKEQYEILRKVLVDRPGEWARVPGNVRLGSDSYLKRSLGVGFEVTGRETVRDEQNRRQIQLWARYIGGAS